jgi:hypothetical protein
VDILRRSGKVSGNSDSVEVDEIWDWKMYHDVSM